LLAFHGIMVQILTQYSVDALKDFGKTTGGLV